jgi:acyl-CoA reductase-like NAD-dependent aldehyde dehydrogenase
MLQIPLLRSGIPYESLTKNVLSDFRTGAPIATVSQANPGLISKDLKSAATCQRILQEFSVTDLIQICKKAANLFVNSNLPVGDAVQSPEEYVRSLSATTGMPHVLCRSNMTKIQSVLHNMEEVLGGLTRGLDLSILDSGWGLQESRPVSYFCETNVLGAILPSNSPGVHSLWLSSIPMKVPLALKPGREEPWTPLRIAQAFLAAGCPREAFHYYPTDYNGATEILLRSGRSILFGDESTVSKWRADQRIQIHGPGCSKIILGEDKANHWDQYLDLMVASVAENGGRSCVNASGVWSPSHGREIAEALAKHLVRIQATPMEDPAAQLAAFSNPRIAQKMNDMVDSLLRIPGAEDVTAPYRKGSRITIVDGGTYLLPTVIWCTDAAHPLAKMELLFPFVSVVELPADEVLEKMGSTLVVTALTEDENLIRQMFSSPDIQRLNLGPVQTNHIAWDQPHEGNLFEHLYRQRALQRKVI